MRGVEASGQDPGGTSGLYGERFAGRGDRRDVDVGGSEVERNHVAGRAKPQ